MLYPVLWNEKHLMFAAGVFGLTCVENKGDYNGSDI